MSCSTASQISLLNYDASLVGSDSYIYYSNTRHLRAFSCLIEFEQIVAAGPFTTSDNLLFEPLTELLSYARRKQPQLLVLVSNNCFYFLFVIDNNENNLASYFIFDSQDHLLILIIQSSRKELSIRPLMKCFTLRSLGRLYTSKAYNPLYRHA